MTRTALIAQLALAMFVTPATAQQWEITTVEDKFAGGVRMYTADSPANSHGGSLVLACRPGMEVTEVALVAVNLNFGSVETLVSEHGRTENNNELVRIKLDGLLAKHYIGTTGIERIGVDLRRLSDGVYGFVGFRRSDRSKSFDVPRHWRLRPIGTRTQARRSAFGDSPQHTMS
ncbi:MAG: hypothetical protein OXR82_00430 [Gammaproteobacteria bacterium]|nr:hypothetical protein [Gammaproteobacteria bacterium]